MLLIGSDVDGRNPFNDAAIGDRARARAKPRGASEQSDDAAPAETTTSTAPHLSAWNGDAMAGWRADRSARDRPSDGPPTAPRAAHLRFVLG
jgi:hypothetical protein